MDDGGSGETNRGDSREAQPKVETDRPKADEDSPHKKQTVPTPVQSQEDHDVGRPVAKSATVRPGVGAQTLDDEEHDC